MGAPTVGADAPEFEAVDGRGEAVRLADLRGRSVVLVFLRHLGCPICRMELAEWSARHGEIASRNAELLVFVDSPADRVAEFAAQAPFRVIADPEHAIYARYGVERGSLLQFAGAAASSLKATLRGHLHGRFEGDELRLPGDFVVAPDGKVRYAHVGRHIGDNTPVDALLREVPG